MYEIKNITNTLNDNEIDNGLYIVIHNPLDVPPHIFLIYNKQYYSLTYDKCFVAKDACKLLALFQTKKTPLLLIEIATSTNFLVAETISKSYKKYTHAGQNNSTCLSPIKDAFSELLSADLTNVNFVYELIPLLESKKIIKKILHKNLAGKINNQTFTLQHYNNNDIFNKIEHYKSKKNNGSTYANKF